MRKRVRFIGFIVLIAVIANAAYGKKATNRSVEAGNVDERTVAAGDSIEYCNLYGISWRGTPKENLTYARQMKYSHVFYQKNMEYDTLSNGLYFYLESPEYLLYNRQVDLTKTYMAQQQFFYETHCSLKDTTSALPDNLATGWFFSKTLFNPILDFQQQQVITWTIDGTLNIVKTIETRNPQFHFGGIAWDVPQPRAIYPRARFIMEPYNIYNGWIGIIKNRPDAKQITPDLLCQESPGTAFADDERLLTTGIITNDRIGCTTPDRFSEQDNRMLAAKAAMNGSWMSWFGRFGGTGDMPNYASITAVPARLKLIRVLSNWENINRTPLSRRSWNGTVYKSDHAFAGPDAIAVLQPGTGKLFIVFLTASGTINIPDGKKVGRIYRTNDYFMETTNGSSDIINSSGKLKLRDVNNMGKGYIVNLINRPVQ